MNNMMLKRRKGPPEEPQHLNSNPKNFYSVCPNPTLNPSSLILMASLIMA